MNTVVFVGAMLPKIIQIQRDIAGIITFPMSSKGILNLLFLLVISFGFAQALMNLDYDASFYIAIVPAVLLISGVWINFTNRLIR